jgi:hypothetical protein
MVKDEVKAQLQVFIDDELWDVVDIVTSSGLSLVASFLSSENKDSWLPFIAIGDGVVTPSSEDKQLASELFRKRGTVTAIENTYFVEADFAVDEPEGDVWIREIGLFNALSGGTLGARWLLVDEILKDYDDSVNIRCAITFTTGA